MGCSHHDQEFQLGISQYAFQSNIGFDAVTKARYSDFIVHEVNINGEISRLEYLHGNLLSERNESHFQHVNVTVDEGGSSGANTTVETIRTAILSDNGSTDSSQSPHTHGTITRMKHPIEYSINNLSYIRKKIRLSNYNTDFKHIQYHLQTVVGCASSKIITSHLSHWESYFPTFLLHNIDESSKYVSLPSIKDKTTRKCIHVLMKSKIFERYAICDTVDQCVRVWHKRFEQDMPNYGLYKKDRKIKKKSWPKNRPDYLQFVLYKENMDTCTAANEIEKLARLCLPDTCRSRKTSKQFRRPSSIAYAGMKDKRSVSSQFCTVYRKTPNDLLVVNKHRDDNDGGGGNRNKDGSGLLRVGNFKYVKDELWLGKLGGNRFDIVLRNIRISSNMTDKIVETNDRLHAAVSCLTNIGFINYFGMQRFGRYRDTHIIGKYVLQRKFLSVIDHILGIKSSDYHNNDGLKKARQQWEDRFSGIDETNTEKRHAAEINCVKSIQHQFGRFGHVEKSLLGFLKRRPGEYKSAFLGIGRSMRCMFLHAYQSYLWNRAASYRYKCNTNIIVGDIVLIEKKDIRKGGSSILKFKEKIIHIITEEDKRLEKYSMEDVVLPLVGSKVLYPLNDTGNLFTTMLKDDGLSRNTFENIKEKDLSLVGDYRKILCHPKNIQCNIKIYRDPLQPLLRTDLMVLKGVELDHDGKNWNDEYNSEKNMNRYKIAGKRSNCTGQNIGIYTNNRMLNDKIQTFKTKQTKINSVLLNKRDKLNKITNNDTNNSYKKKTKLNSEHEDKKFSISNMPKLIGMILSFTLPSSAYATIALRELMRRPTSSEYQSALMLEGNCE